GRPAGGADRAAHRPQGRCPPRARAQAGAADEADRAARARGRAGASDRGPPSLHRPRAPRARLRAVPPAANSLAKARKAPLPAEAPSSRSWDRNPTTGPPGPRKPPARPGTVLAVPTRLMKGLDREFREALRLFLRSPAFVAA